PDRRKAPEVAEDPRADLPGAFVAPPWPDFLANCGEFAQEAAQAAPHQRAFLDPRYRPDDFDGWLAETRARLIDLLHYAPAANGLDPEPIAVEEGDGYRRETIWISTAPWSRVRCDVLIPAR